MTTPFPQRPSRQRAHGWPLAAATALLALAAAAGSADAATDNTAPAASRAGMGHHGAAGPGPEGAGPRGMGEGAAHGPRGGMHEGRGPGMGMGGMGMMDGQHLNRVLDQVQATPEQRSKVTALMTAARKDLQAQHQAGRDLQQRLMLALTQPTVDSKAVEALRQQMLAQHDKASQRMTQALVDTSRVLTAEQRASLNQRMAMAQRHQAERAALDAAKPAR